MSVSVVLFTVLLSLPPLSLSLKSLLNSCSTFIHFALNPQSLEVSTERNNCELWTCLYGLQHKQTFHFVIKI